MTTAPPTAPDIHRGLAGVVVVTSTLSDLYSAVTAKVGERTESGPTS